MKKINITIVSIITLFFVLLNSCKKDEPHNGSTSTQADSAKTDKQLNITFLLDLSDRIEPTKYPDNPQHFQKDIAIMQEFVELFKKDMEKNGGYRAKGKMKVIFSPTPNDTEINTIASKLNIDLSKMDNKQKKIVFDNLNKIYSDNLNQIYSKTIQSKNYIGSDIWRFFKNDVKDYAVDDSPNYRNILVIITDGYIYYKNSIEQQGNKTSYLTPELIAKDGFRNPNWKNKFNSGNFGFITTRKDLGNLDVLVLEINPENNNLNDEDVIKTYLSKWFTEMGIKKFELYNSDLPEKTKTRIEKFIN